MSTSDQRAVALLQDADSLYSLVPADFTARRDALVREHRGDAEHAAALKALRKPSLAAWTVNLLVRREPERVEGLLAVGAALREAQDQLDAGALREFARQRRALTAEVTTHARRVAREAGTRVTESVAEQVEATLTAATLSAEASRAVRSGMLIAALRPSDSDDDVVRAVAASAALGYTATPFAPAEPIRPTLRVISDPDGLARRVEEADEALDVARIDHEVAAGEVATATGEVTDLQARTLELSARADELRARLAEVEAELDEVDADLEDAEDALGIAQLGLDVARAALQRAEETRARLD